MIWYLLYPIRGTTEAPVLPPSNPLRSAFARYGRYVARHVVTTLLISAAVASILIYPIPFLFTTDFTNGASNLPHHVWTVAQPLPYNAVAQADVIMRSIWVHGSYMEALKHNLLASALDLQDELLGTTENFNPALVTSAPELPSNYDLDLSPSQRDAFHIVHGSTNQSWFFHSPLQYWSCSRDRILTDHDVVATVNKRKNLPTSVNVTLRHSVVFSGKRFERRRLMAADALVITLLHRRDSPVGRQWERKAALLAESVKDLWDVYPPDGRISSSRLYEFQFRPMSAEDTVTLGLAYGLALSYFLMSLLKLRAVKSKIGLMVTVVTQVIISVMSSFTICAVFNIDLSRIPSVAYPLVILAMSLENIFRLIGAVISMPPGDPTSSKIGHAFGQTAPVALASSAQNVFILALLSRFVSPGVAGFCSFLAVAIVFDVFYLSTFFLSVLSVDVRRTELSDALAKVAIRRHHRRANYARTHKTWVEQMLQGKTALSTRIAGTCVMVGFLFLAQWHFFQRETITGYYKASDIPHSLAPSKDSLLDSINQARSPTSWLRLQDHETAHELINVIKPSSHSYVAQVYDPIVFVMKGSDRNHRNKEPALLPAAYDFINHQLTQSVVIVVVIIALLRLLISYLLWQDEESIEADRDPDNSPLFTVKSLSQGHTLDIVMLNTSVEGHVVSVGLDRVIRVWDVRSGTPSHALPNTLGSDALFPIYAVATDDKSKWLAILTHFRVVLWGLQHHKWGPSIPVDLFGQRPEAFFFAPSALKPSPTLIIVRRNGSLVELDAMNDGSMEEFSICKSALLCAEPVVHKGNGTLAPRLSIATAAKYGCDNKPGCIHLATRSKFGWGSREINLSVLSNQKPHQLLGLPALGVFVVATSSKVLMFSVDTLEMLHSLETELMKPRSLQIAYSYQRLYPNAPGCTSATVSYVGSESGDCVMHILTPPEDADAICASSSSSMLDDEGCSWGAAKENKKRTQNPGHFAVLSDGSVVGMRHTLRPRTSRDKSPQKPFEGLRNRFSGRKVEGDAPQRWEVWIASSGSREELNEVRPLFDDKEESAHLLISELGPSVKVGLNSVAFSFGNIVKLVTLGGQERFDHGADENGHERYLGSRRRKQVNKPRTWSS